MAGEWDVRCEVIRAGESDFSAQLHEIGFRFQASGDKGCRVKF